MKYTTKPFEIEAVQFTGMNQEVIEQTFPDVELQMGPDNDIEVWDYLQKTWVLVNQRDYIIKGMKGEYYPCNPEVFEAKYTSYE